MTDRGGTGVPDPCGRSRAVARILLIAVIISVGLIVWTPGPPADPTQHDLMRWFDHAHRHGLPSWAGFALVEASSNVAMFIPLGLLGALSLRRRQWLVVPLAALTSATIEVVQLAALPQRTASWHDVAMNTGGALLGLLLAVPALRRRRRRERRAALGRRSAADRRPGKPGHQVRVAV